jgi:hypothetical protein
MKKYLVVALAVLALISFTSNANALVTAFVQGVQKYQAPQNQVYFISNTLDFSDLQTKGPSSVGKIAGVTAMTTPETVQLLYIPAGTVVREVGMRIYSAWGTAGLTCYGVNIGDGSAVSGWMANLDWGPSASGTSSSVSSVSGYVAGDGTDGDQTYQPTAGMSPFTRNGRYAKDGGKYYSAADTIDATLPRVAGWGGIDARAGLTDFKIQVWAICIKPSTQLMYTRPPAF